MASAVSLLTNEEAPSRCDSIQDFDSASSISSSATDCSNADDSSSYLSSDDEDFLESALAHMQGKKSRMHVSISDPHLHDTEMSAMQVSVLLNQMRVSQKQKAPTSTSFNKEAQERQQMRRSSVIGSSSMANGDSQGAGPNAVDDETTTSPTDVLNDILQDAKISASELEPTELDEYFVPVTQERVAAYSTEIINAVRMSDIDTLRQMHVEQDLNLSCCNKFGESILHTACRRGMEDVVAFLVCEANVDLRVRDDYGRTPMHDTCWTAEPNMTIVKLLLSKWPELLFIKEKRGFTPLQYVRKSHWPEWCDFLQENQSLVLHKLQSLPEE